MVFGSKIKLSRNNDILDVKIKNSCVEQVNSFKYLGVYLDPSITCRGVSWGGALGARAPRGHQRGAKKKEKRKGKERERGEKRGKEGKKREKGEERGSKKKKRKERKKLNQYDEGSAMQFQVQAEAPGKKTSGAHNRRRKGREGRHAVSSASRGSREENVRGAKFDGEKDERGAMQFQVQARAPGKKTSGAPN